MPNFLILGTEHSGTTSLYYYLRQHPQVYMSGVKEPAFFTDEGKKLDRRWPLGSRRHFRTTTIEQYRKLFREVKDEKAVGEATPAYLHNPEAAPRIKRYIPKAKMIILLRHPVDRAFSHFLEEYLVDSSDPVNEFFNDFKKYPDEWLRYVDMGFYALQLKHYLEYFDRGQFCIFLTEDMARDTGAVLREIFGFLEIDDAFRPDISIRHNKSGVAKNRFLEFMFSTPLNGFIVPRLPEWALRFATKLKNGNVAKVGLPAEMRRELVGLYRDDVLELQDIIQRDLSQWLA